MNAIIIEDEPAGRKLLQRLVEEHCPDVRVVGLAASAAEGRKAIAQHHPDLVFLDVEMPGESGVDMLKKLTPVGFDVIFVTAHQGYAIEAIRMSALDYLLKPVRTDELVAAVRKVREKAERGRVAEQVANMFNNLNGAEAKIGISTRKGILFIPVREIVRCDAASNYTTLVLAGGESHVASRTLKHFEELLERHRFIRVHSSHLVNARYIGEYVRGDGGTLVLTDGSRIDVSRRYKENLLRLIEKV
jgi:two-component system, LytTR family, response regulator